MSGPDRRPGSEPEYAPPVDPWAAAEAEHRAALEAEREAALLEAADQTTADQAAEQAADQTTPERTAPTVPTQSAPDRTMLDHTALISGDVTTGGAAPTDGSPDRTAEPAAAGGRRGLFAYRRAILWGAAAVTVVVAASAAALVFWWPRDGAALDFRALDDVRKLAAPESSTFVATQVVGDRTYLAGAPAEGPLVVTAVGTTTGDEIWRSDAAGTVAQWERVVGLPGEDAVVAIGRPDPSDPALRLVVLGGDKGALLWERQLGSDDKVLFVGDTVIVAEKETAQVVGLDLHDKGKVRWTKANPKNTSGGTATAVVAATTPDDLAGPADGEGTAFAPDLGDDTRFVQIGADRSAQVFDAVSGKRVTQRSNVAEPDDIVLAHDGTLFVASAQNGYQIVRYDLAKLGQPALVYAAPDSTRQLLRLAPCGSGRLCLLDAAGYDKKTTDVVAVGAGGDGELWRRPAPGAETLVPVGTSVLIGRDTSPASVRLVDAKGATGWDRGGSAVRVDRGNVLLFAKPLPDNAADVSVAGQHLGDEVVQLGPMTGAVTSSCSWNAEIIACAADDGFVLRRFVA
jgi:molecular chaperone HscA